MSYGSKFFASGCRKKVTTFQGSVTLKSTGISREGRWPQLAQIVYIYIHHAYSNTFASKLISKFTPMKEIYTLSLSRCATPLPVPEEPSPVAWESPKPIRHIDFSSGVECPLASDDQNPCTVRADKVFRCYDRESVGGHWEMMRVFSGFSDEKFSHFKAADVDEDSEVMAILCHFMHNRIYPDVMTMPWDPFVKLAMASEKYGIHSAMAVCKIRMELNLTRRPLEVFIYASATQYKDLALRSFALCLDTHPLQCFTRSIEMQLEGMVDRASVHTLCMPVQEVIASLKSFRNWTLPFTAWAEQRSELQIKRTEILRSPNVKLHTDEDTACDSWNIFHADVCFNAARTGALNDVIDTVTFVAVVDASMNKLGRCKECISAAVAWKEDFAKAISSLTPFSTYRRKFSLRASIM